jgi:hypothetical protein
MQSLLQVGECFIKLLFIYIFDSPSRFQAGLDRMYPSSNLSVILKLNYIIFLGGLVILLEVVFEVPSCSLN